MIKYQTHYGIHGIASFTHQHFNEHDLHSFWDKYNITYTSNITSIGIFSNISGPGETQLDIEYLTGISQNIETQSWYTPFSDDCFLRWTIDVNNAEFPVADIFSISFSSPEIIEGNSYMLRVSQELAKMVAKGITLFFATGDSGSEAVSCTYSNGINTANFPATSPYVTAVGGVMNDMLPEQAWINGGAGFSQLFERPYWQNKSVTNYLNYAQSNNLLPTNISIIGNYSNRAIPDISAQSVYYLIIMLDIEFPVNGTSCSTPTIGAIFSLLNQLRVENNLNKLGWINPLLYKIGNNEIGINSSDSFNDCTMGFNKGCDMPSKRGFYAIPGWDIPTGFGSPNFEKLKKYILETGRDQTEIHQRVVSRQKMGVVKYFGL